MITGATGFTGSRLARALAAAGVRLRGIARPGSDRTVLEDVDVEWLLGDVYDRELVAEAMADVHYVFHVAAVYRRVNVDEDELRRVHVESTQLLARAAKGLSGFRRFVHVSTIGVHGHIADPPADETAPLRPDDAYQRTKAEAEEWLRSFSGRGGLPATVVRPCAIMGPGDRRLLKLFRLAAGPVFPILGYGECLYHLIHVDDLVEVLMRAAVRPEAKGATFIAGNKNPVRLERMARLIGDALGRTPRVVRLPAAPFFAAARICEAVCRPLGVEPPLHRRRVAFYTKDRSFDTRKMRRCLGVEPRSNRRGLQETAIWYRQQGWLP